MEQKIFDIFSEVSGVDASEITRDTVLAGGVDIAQLRPRHNEPACFREPQGAADLNAAAGMSVDEQANAAVLLNSPLASAINGVNLRTDCGYLSGSWLV